MLDRYRPFNRLVAPRRRWTIGFVRLILIAAFTGLVWLAAACGSDEPATRPTPAGTATITSPPARVADVRFVPTVSSVGEVLKVQGFNWQRGPITVYLVPESQRANVESGSTAELYVLGESSATSTGMFNVNILLPADLANEAADRRISVAPGRYVVAAKGVDGLRVGAVLTVR